MKLNTTFQMVSTFILILFADSIYANEGDNAIFICEDVILAISSCTDFAEADYLLEVLPSCTASGIPFGPGVEIWDAEGNPVPNPIPNDPNYICQTLDVLNICLGDTCRSTITITVYEGPRITTVPIDVIPAQNYLLDNIPRPRVEYAGCIGSEGATLSYEDETVGTCEVPLVHRTWRAVDKCGNVSESSQIFGINTNMSCRIIGSPRMPIGIESLIKSKITPGGLPPYSFNWSVIGDGWNIRGGKTNPAEAFLLPTGPAPSQARVMLEMTDQFGCQNSCFRDFTSFIPKSFSAPSEGFIRDIGITESSLLITLENDELTDLPFQVVDIYGRIIKQGLFQGDFSVIDMTNAPTGLFILRIDNEGELITRKFIKM